VNAEEKMLLEQLLSAATDWTKSWTEKAYPNLIHFNKLPKGGHFAAWEHWIHHSEDFWTAKDQDGPVKLCAPLGDNPVLPLFG
jgi:hypothetical protein